MPDISKCDGTGCPIRDRCYRYTSKPSEYNQAYFMNPPIVGKDCQYFWEDEYNKSS